MKAIEPGGMVGYIEGVVYIGEIRARLRIIRAMRAEVPVASKGGSEMLAQVILGRPLSGQNNRLECQDDCGDEQIDEPGPPMKGSSHESTKTAVEVVDVG